MQEHTVTGEAVVLNLRAANFLPRLGAAVMDALIYVVCWVLLWILLGNVANGFAFDVAAARMLTLVMTIVLIFIVPLLVEGLSKGRSLGKVTFGLRVVRDDGGTIRWRHAFIRALTGVFEMWLTAGSVAVVVSLFNAKSRRLGDMMAGTYVMMVRAPKLPPPLPGVPPQMRQWATVADIGRLPILQVTQAQSLVRNARQMDPEKLVETAEGMANRMSPYVTPGPPPNVDAYLFLVGVLAERRRRDLEVLARRKQRQQRDAQFLAR